MSDKVNSVPRRRGLWSAFLLTAVIALMFLSGCIETQVKVRLELDGTGTRRVEMVWKQSDLEDLDLSDDDLRRILALPAERGWTMRREDRPVRDGSLEPHVVFERVVELESIEAWRSEASDLHMSVDSDLADRTRDEVYVEVGRGSSYRTIGYRERLDGVEIRERLDRMVASFLAEKLGEGRPRLGNTEEAEIRGLLLGHLRHHRIWAVEDEEIDEAWDAVVEGIAFQLGYILEGRKPSSREVASAQALLREVIAAEDVNEWLDERLPGLGLLALMNLKLEVVVPGAIVESNADRVGEGFAAWERPAWEAIGRPLEFQLRARIED